METCTSEEDLIIKARKPYTITKQRERWSAEEHNRFLEALKLYGRAWQRIEVHIGTKTAVQIRSHAQKFFTKVEKEAIAKGIPVGEALDIEIPPPRPKRKPSYPYPRKSCDGSPTLLVGAKEGKRVPSISSPCLGKQFLDLEREPVPENPSEGENPENANENAAPNTPFSSAAKTLLSTPVAPGEGMWERKKVDPIEESQVTAEPSGKQKLAIVNDKQSNEDNGTISTLKYGNSNQSIDKLVTAEENPPENFIPLSPNDMRVIQNEPRHVPVHAASSITTEHEDASKYSDHQSFHTYHHHPLFTPVLNTRDDNGLPIHDSSALSSVLVSTLLQNSAAALLAGANMNPCLSTASIVAATVAAATAWWAAHGLMPFCSTPLNTDFICNPAPTAAAASDSCLTAVANNERREYDPTVEIPDSKRVNSVKIVDHSSCGSNAPYSCEIESDAFKKYDKSKEETGVGGRSSISTSESWKAVSEEGRVAFQALFSREVLPQSFLHLHDKRGKDEKIEKCSGLDLNSESRAESSDLNREEVLLKLGIHNKARRTGFRPYKRCSVEAKDSRATTSSSNHCEEKFPKKLRLESGASP